MKRNQLIKRLGIAALFTVSSSEVMAHKYWTDCNTPRKWPTSGFTFNANPAGFDGQYAFWRTSFASALSQFNATPVNLNIGVQLDNDTSVGVANGESEIWWDSNGNSAIGYNITDSCGNTVEGDIIFHNTVPYVANMSDKTSFWNYGGNSRTFETTALHEVGHTIGLAHENRYYNIMGSDYTHVHTTGETALRSYMGEDATNGLISLYGGSNREDLSVAAWRHIGSSGEYSTHGRTRLFNSNGSVLSSSKAVSSCNSAYCEMRYNVNPGQQIQYEMTLENNGRNSQFVQLGYYISTNATITTSDTLIGTDMVTVTRNTPDTVRKNITIPGNLNSNTNYYLGVIIDNGNSVSEWTEANNTSYMHIRTGDGGTPNPDPDPDPNPNPGNLENACATEGPTTNSGLRSGDAICVPDGWSSNSIQYYYIYVPSGTSRIVIQGGHGTGNGNLYYKASNWATATSYDQRSVNSGNTESITVNNPTSGYRYISVVGDRNDMTLKVELQ